MEGQSNRLLHRKVDAPLPAALLAISLFPFLVLAAVHWPFLPRLESGDYAQYILHAKALVEGRPYGDTGYLFSPLRPFVGPRLLPPGLPLTLAPLVALVGGDSALLRLPMVGSALAFLYFVWRYLKTRYSPWLAAAAVAMTGVALESGYATLTVLSDLGFSALVWATILVADHEADRPWSVGRIVAVTTLGLAAMAYRVAGIALIPAALGYALLNRRRLGARAFIAPVAWGVVLLVGVGQNLVSVGSTVPLSRLAAGWSRMVRENLVGYRQSLFDALLYPFPLGLLNDVYHLLALPVVLLGLVMLFRERWRSLLACFTLAYALMLAAVPGFDTRYAWPLFPLLAAGLVLGVARVVRGIRALPNWDAQRVTALAVALPLVALAGLRAVVRPEPPSLLGNTDLQALLHEVRTTMSPATDRVVFMNPRVLTLETGIPAMAALHADSTAKALRELTRARISYVITGDLGSNPRAEAFMVRTVRENAAHFALRYQNASFLVYRFLPAGVAAVQSPRAGPRSERADGGHEPGASCVKPSRRA